MNKVLVFLTALAVFSSSCQNQNNETESEVSKKESAEQKADKLEKSEGTEEIKTDKLDVDSLVKSIKSYRASIEQNLGEAKSFSTEDMRPQVKQKWSKVHFYTNDNNEVLRIKTYPHEEVSERTEEFYIKEGNLVCAVIEDKGLGEKGNTGEDKGKVYYYHDGEFLQEENNTGEKEYQLRKSDAEQLMQEAREYLDYHKRN